MPGLDLDNIDEKLLGLLQRQFPLTPTPYADLGLKLDIEASEVIQRIQRLKSQGIIRQISPVLDARKLGYQSTLVAMEVPAEHLEKAQQTISGHPGISHGYRRNHDFNIWITLSIRQEAVIEAELEKLASSIGVKTIFSLPALKIYKLRAIFGRNEDDQSEETTALPGILPEKLALSPLDRDIINGLQQDLPLEAQPFSTIASGLGIGVNEFLEQCQSLLQRGIIRRFGAAVNHSRAGYKANAMACWVAPPDKLDFAGQKLSSLHEVSHCYERKANPFWKHNLFAMIHGRTRKDCLRLVNNVSSETGLTEHMVLFSTQELKKIRVKYQV
jgi:DNA-binding Lrp family transcriptional regulator